MSKAKLVLLFVHSSQFILMQRIGFCVTLRGRPVGNSDRLAKALRRPSRSAGEFLALNDLRSTLNYYHQRQKGDPVTHSNTPYTHHALLPFTIFLFYLPSSKLLQRAFR